MHIVSACFPWADALRKKLSRLNATLGRYPKSSSNVNRGKNIAIGGSITDMTHANVLKIPSTNMPVTQYGAESCTNNELSGSSNENKAVDRNPEGTFAPVIVIQKIPNSSPIIMGIPVSFDVSILSILRSLAL